jgi:hypothetical protein
VEWVLHNHVSTEPSLPAVIMGDKRNQRRHKANPAVPARTSARQNALSDSNIASIEPSALPASPGADPRSLSMPLSTGDNGNAGDDRNESSASSTLSEPLQSSGSKRQSTQALSDLSSSSDDSDDSDSVAAGQPTKKRSRREEKEILEPASASQYPWRLGLSLFPEIALFVPSGTGNMLEQRIVTDTNEPFHFGIRDEIHRKIGCEEAQVMPDLAYKLADAPKKSKPIVLASEEDWQGLIEAVNIENHKRLAKRPPLKGTYININIEVPEQVCLVFSSSFICPQSSCRLVYASRSGPHPEDCWCSQKNATK